MKAVVENLKFTKEELLKKKAKGEITDTYDFVELIGEGAFGKVYRAKNKLSTKEVAIKQVFRKDNSNKLL